MKKIFYFTLSLFFYAAQLDAQSVAINTDGSVANSSSILDIKSITKGLLIPRMTTVQRTAIATPAKGLMVFDTVTNSFWYYNGAGWATLSGSSNGWGLTGNAATNPATNFIGTTDNQPLRFKINNVWAGEIHPASGNIFFGLGAGNTGTTGESNTAIGEHALYANADGNFNTAQGYYALAANTSGFNNTAHGTYALTNNTTGSHNTAIGRNALFANTTSGNNTAVGEGALLANTGQNNNANGFQALFSNTTGEGNTATGYRALYSNSTGGYNNANGFQALYSNDIGYYNNASGGFALYSNTSGTNNTAFGDNSLSANTTGNNNTAFGSRAMRYSQPGGESNTAVGIDALSFNKTGDKNTANGGRALFNNDAGAYNCAMGFEAMLGNNNGFYNTALGVQALSANTYGYFNTAIGMYALSSNVTGGNNIAIGYNSGTGGANAANLSNTIGIGNTGGFLNGASNQAIIGNESMYFIGGKVNWGIVSDARIKNTVVEDVKGLDFIMRLRPVTYHISNSAIATLTGAKATPDFPGKYDVEKIKYSGFLAQEVEQAAKASSYEFSGYDAPKNPSQLYTIKYAEFVVPLVKAMQEQQVIITTQQKQIAMLEKRLAALEIKSGAQ